MDIVAATSKGSTSMSKSRTTIAAAALIAFSTPVLAETNWIMASGYPEVVVDLAIEILSAGNTPAEMARSGGSCSRPGRSSPLMAVTRTTLSP